MLDSSDIDIFKDRMSGIVSLFIFNNSIAKFSPYSLSNSFPCRLPTGLGRMQVQPTPLSCLFWVHDRGDILSVLVPSIGRNCHTANRQCPFYLQR